jgi:hypothetical protein
MDDVFYLVIGGVFLIFIIITCLDKTDTKERNENRDATNDENL